MGETRGHRGATTQPSHIVNGKKFITRNDTVCLVDTSSLFIYIHFPFLRNFQSETEVRDRCDARLGGDQGVTKNCPSTNDDERGAGFLSASTYDFAVVQAPRPRRPRALGRRPLLFRRQVIVVRTSGPGAAKGRPGRPVSRVSPGFSAGQSPGRSS